MVLTRLHSSLQTQIYDFVIYIALEFPSITCVFYSVGYFVDNFSIYFYIYYIYIYFFLCMVCLICIVFLVYCIVFIEHCVVGFVVLGFR